MLRIRSRFVVCDDRNLGLGDNLVRAELIALNVRKIIEGVVFASLSAAEIRNQRLLAQQRTKDPDKLLKWLRDKGLLHLPSAQRMGTLEPGFAAVLEGGKGAAAGLDVAPSELLSMYSRASALVHERHPESIVSERLSKELAAIEADLCRLKNWLWLHIMFLSGTGYLVQMVYKPHPSW
jgi:hypothetical protein